MYIFTVIWIHLLHLDASHDLTQIALLKSVNRDLPMPNQAIIDNHQPASLFSKVNFISDYQNDWIFLTFIVSSMSRKLRHFNKAEI